METDKVPKKCTTNTRSAFEETEKSAYNLFECPIAYRLHFNDVHLFLAIKIFRITDHRESERYEAHIRYTFWAAPCKHQIDTFTSNPK